MKKTVLAAALALTFFLSACSGDSGVIYKRPSDDGKNASRSWTVLVYMIGGAGETQTGVSSEKLRDIMNVRYNDDVRVAVQTGGSAVWHEKGVDSDYLQRFEAGNGALYLADQSAAADMGDYETLENFLKWGTSHYKSDKYMLIISGLGGGSLYGIGADELFKNDVLTLEEISYAMSLTGKNFDVVGMDASLMGSLETAVMLSTSANYLVATQEMQDASAWDYSQLISYLCENPSADGAQAGRAICDACYGKAVSRGEDMDFAMSVADISKVSTLNQAFDGMAGYMLTATDSLDNYKQLSDALSGVRIYGGASADEGYSDLADLGDMAAKIREYVGGTSDRLKETLDDTIEYKICGENNADSGGMSVYYPISGGSDSLEKYINMSLSDKYTEFLRKICVDCEIENDPTPDFTTTWAWNTYNEDMAWMQYDTILDGNSYELHISGNMDLFRDVAVNVYKQDKKSGKYVFAGKHRKIRSDWEGGIFIDDFDCELPSFGGRTVGLVPVRNYDGVELYSFPAAVNGENRYVRVTRGADGKYEISSVWGGLGTNGLVVSVDNSGEDISGAAPLLTVYNDEHEKREYILGSYAKKFSEAVEERRIEDGNYMFEFEITDVYGKKRWGTPVYAQVSGKRITF